MKSIFTRFIVQDAMDITFFATLNAGKDNSSFVAAITTKEGVVSGRSDHY